MSYLPSDSYKNQLSLYNNFNNQLISGHNSGLALYNYDTDMTLYKKLDIKPLDNVNFDTINKKIKENDNIYNKVKSVVSGGINGAAQGGSDAFNTVLHKLGEGVGDFFRSLFGLNSSNITTAMGFLLISFIILKKI